MVDLERLERGHKLARHRLTSGSNIPRAQVTTARANSEPVRGVDLNVTVGLYSTLGIDGPHGLLRTRGPGRGADTD